MKRKIALSALFIMCVMFIAGLVLIFSAPTIGLNAGNTAIVNNGGSMDTNQFERIIEGTSLSFQTGGLVISLVGGFGLLASGYALYREV